jgi:hypothetical protein
MEIRPLLMACARYVMAVMSLTQESANVLKTSIWKKIYLKGSPGCRALLTLGLVLVEIIMDFYLLQASANLVQVVQPLP